MAPPNLIKARFFQRISDGAWTARIDTSGPNPSMTVAQAEAHCAAEYGFPVRCVEAELAPADFETLKTQRRLGAVMPPAKPAPPLTPEQEAYRLATTDQKIEMVAKRTGLVP